MKIFPDQLSKLWNKWELRTLVLLSLTLQIILISVGSRRKYNTKNGIRVILWLAYLSADWVATVSLGVLSNSQGDSIPIKRTLVHSQGDTSNYAIMALWAPFLLLHLGGPDTITAYSLEDNELWLRHLLGLVVQVGVAFYVFLRSLQPTEVNFIAFPIFVAGCVKYGERTWVLRSASSQHFRKSLLPRPDPGPNYSKFMEEYTLKESEGFELDWSVTQAPQVVAHDYAARRNNQISDVAVLNAAYEFFLTYKRLFADLILSFQDLEKSLSYFQSTSWETAFKVIEVELGFMYDVFYTKATIIYSLWGVLLRSISLTSTISALISFSMIQRHEYESIDVSITLLLLVGAICLEIYAVLLLLSSDWTFLWLSKHKNWFVDNVYGVLSSFRWITSKKKWSNSVAQYNLLSSCFNSKPAKCCQILKSACIHQIIESYLNDTSVCVPPKLKEFIFEQLVEKSRSASDYRVCKELCAFRGGQALQQKNCIDKLGWSIKVEFDHSILLWHIATDLCYNCDLNEYPDIVSDLRCLQSKLLSDYMLYILVKLPFMLPNGIGQIRLQDTVAEVNEILQEDNLISGKQVLCRNLLQVDIKIAPEEVKGDRSKSVLFDACKLAKCLQSLEREEQWEKQKKWEMISHVWVEMLSYAASQCRWNHHAQQLRRGGELLSHVWLLMAHLGLTEQFQISQGHARTKLIVK